MKSRKVAKTKRKKIQKEMNEKERESKDKKAKREKEMNEKKVCPCRFELQFKKFLQTVIQEQGGILINVNKYCQLIDPTVYFTDNDGLFGQMYVLVSYLKFNNIVSR